MCNYAYDVLYNRVCLFYYAKWSAPDGHIWPSNGCYVQYHTAAIIYAYVQLSKWNIVLEHFVIV